MNDYQRVYRNVWLSWRCWNIFKVLDPFAVTLRRHVLQIRYPSSNTKFCRYPKHSHTANLRCFFGGYKDPSDIFRALLLNAIGEQHDSPTNWHPNTCFVTVLAGQQCRNQDTIDMVASTFLTVMKPWPSVTMDIANLVNPHIPGFNCACLPINVKNCKILYSMKGSILRNVVVVVLLKCLSHFN